MTQKRLSDYLPAMQTDDVLAATDKAKVHARTLLEDQGITILALLLADLLADTTEQGKIEISQPVPAGFAVQS